MIYFKWISLLLSTPIMIYSAQPFYVGAWRSLKQGHLSMDVSVSLALIGAFVASIWATVFNTGEVYYDSITMFVFFLLLGRLLELRARRKASESSSNLARLVPIMATRIDDDGEHEVAAKTLRVGDRVRVLAGPLCQPTASSPRARPASTKPCSPASSCPSSSRRGIPSLPVPSTRMRRWRSASVTPSRSPA